MNFNLDIQDDDFVKLNDLWDLGNEFRTRAGVAKLELCNYLRSPSTLKFIEALERKLDVPSIRSPAESFEVSSRLSNTIRTSLIRSVKGRYNGGTFVHKYILLHAASKFTYEYQLIIFDKIDQFDKLIVALNSFEIDDELLVDSNVDMFIYAIKECSTGNVKIGISKHPEVRLRQLQTGNSSKLELLKVVPAVNRFKTEKELHLLNSDKHILGEWFNETARIDLI
jgi:hypothetical protein